jgi:sec-independent protein translocase protein TatA
MSVGPTELLLIALVVFLLFGTRRLGDLGKGIGEGIRNFKRGLSGDSDNAKPESPKQLSEKSDEKRK